MHVEAIAYLTSTRTPLQGFFPLSTSQLYIWERGKGIVRVQYLTQEHNGWSLLGDKIGLLKVARSDFWVTIPFNFKRLELHHYQSNRKSNISAVLKKHESFKLGTFHQDLSYHSNEMMPCPILHNTE